MTTTTTMMMMMMMMKSTILSPHVTHLPISCHPPGPRISSVMGTPSAGFPSVVSSTCDVMGQRRLAMPGSPKSSGTRHEVFVVGSGIWCRQLE
jgi:hypothetical protein